MKKTLKGMLFLPLAIILPGCDNVDLTYVDINLRSGGLPSEIRHNSGDVLIAQPGEDIADNTELIFENYTRPDGFDEYLGDPNGGTQLSGSTPLGIFSYYLSRDRTLSQDDILLAIAKPEEFLLPAHSTLIVSRHPGAEDIRSSREEHYSGEFYNVVLDELGHLVRVPNEHPGLEAQHIIPSLVIPDTAEGEYQLLVHVAPPNLPTSFISTETDSNPRSLYSMWVGNDADLSFTTLGRYTLEGLDDGTRIGDTLSNVNTTMELINRGNEAIALNDVTLELKGCWRRCTLDHTLTTKALSGLPTLLPGHRMEITVVLDDFILPENLTEEIPADLLANITSSRFCFSADLLVPDEIDDIRSRNNQSRCVERTIELMEES